MTDTDLVELADSYSRRRAGLALLAAVVFLGGQFLAGSRVFGARPQGAAVTVWAINAIILLAVLATGGGPWRGGRVRALVHDELSRAHLRTAVVVGYWVAMGLAFVLYLAPPFQAFSAQQAIVVMVTGSVVVSLLTFAGLEGRAHVDG